MRAWFGFQLIFLLAVSVKRGVSDKDKDTCCAGTLFRNCKEVREQYVLSGWYTIYPDQPKGKPMLVFCDMETDGGGWLVFQRRRDGSIDFYRDWESYKKGFGSQESEFWLGNENIHLLTSLEPQELRIDLEDFENNRTYAKYTNFKIEDESNKYKLKLKFLDGDMGDSMWYSKKMEFSTKDKDHDKHSTNCAQSYKGGWWFRSCHAAHLNGLYLKGEHNSYADGINWKSGKGYYYSYKISEMKMRPEK